jgi:uncharacterized protein (DUF362 family)
MQLGTTYINKINNQNDMDAFLSSLDITGNNILIKPNWVSYSTGEYTDAKVLDMFLTALGKPAILIESHTFWRTDKMAKNEGDYFSSSEGTLETGKAHRDFFIQQDKLFLESTGISEVLKKHKSEYLCITEEIWNGDSADPEEIKKITESKYTPVIDKDLYNVVPKKLLDLRGAELINLSKAKLDSSYGASLSIKNPFGLIPDPTRYVKYHGGEREDLLVQNIIDINKIYQALFKTTFVVEGVFNNCFMNWDTNKAEPFFDWGVILGGKDGLEVDTIGCKLIGTEFKESLAELKLKYKETFGGNDNVSIDSVDRNFFQNVRKF